MKNNIVYPKYSVGKKVLILTPDRIYLWGIVTRVNVTKKGFIYKVAHSNFNSVTYGYTDEQLITYRPKWVWRLNKFLPFITI